VQLIYAGDYSQRAASDIDLLVLPGDVDQVAAILHSLGYRDLDREPWPGYFRRFLNGSHFISNFLEPGSGRVFNVDLHWGFPDPPYYDRRIAVEALFERAKSITIEGVDVGNLAVEDTVIYASVHNAHHGYRETLSRHYDLAALIRMAGSSLNWEALLANAAAWRVILPLRRTLTDLDALWPGVIPPPVMGRLPGLKASLSERLIDWGLSRSTNKEAANILLSCWNTPGLLWRARFFLETAFPGPAYLRYYFGKAPGSLWPLLYFRRFIRFFRG
ncbi:MAG TPA: nucleotidyltransferase family protein, partial [Anaerolineales bacterium]|nr:nucleotidyltransferase family protein [Anaerolineales bacterium]